MANKKVNKEQKVEKAALIKSIRSRLIDLGLLDPMPKNLDNEKKGLYMDMMRAAILNYQATKRLKCDGKLSQSLLQSLNKE